MLMATVVTPFLLLILLGNAFGGAISNVPIAIVRDSYGSASSTFIDNLQTDQTCRFGGTNCKNSFQIIDAPSLGTAQNMLRDGLVKAVVYIPLTFDDSSADHLIDFYLDTTDPLTAAIVSPELAAASQQALSGSTLTQHQQATSSQVGSVVQSSFYSNLLYIEFMAPGTIVNAMMFVALIGGGITILNDRERGVIEGYLVTPLKRYEIVSGVLMAGVVKAVLSAGAVTVLAVVVAGVHPTIDLAGAVLVLLTLALTALGMLSMVTAIAVRAPSADMLRFLIVPLNLTLYFSSGAIYPIQAFPNWLQAIASVNPETYGVHALRLLMYKQASLPAIIGDLTFLAVFTALMLVIATLVFRRSL